MNALAAIAAERRRQIEVEGWTAEHDDTHFSGELADAAACYAAGGRLRAPVKPGSDSFVPLWPWSLSWWKQSDRLRDLIKAGALIVAEIERINRAEGRSALPALDPRDALIKELADALQDSIESSMGRELRARDLPREWHRAQSVLKGAGASFQERNAEWMGAAFRDDPTDLAERVARFGEESLELQQSLGQSREDAHALVDYAFDREVGEPSQEVGGTMTTLALLAEVAGHDMDACGERELARCWTPEVLAKISRKRASRHGRGALPGFAAE